MSATIKSHRSPDWCHWCGLRVDTADVWWPENAEHDHGLVNQREAVAARRYVRICAECARRVLAVTEMPGALDEARDRAERNEDRAVETERLAMDLANTLYEEHGGPRVSEGLHGPCVVCKLIERAREWAK